MVGVCMVLVSHGHYTIDIIVAYYVTTRLFWTYHTLANNSLLLKVIEQRIRIYILITQFDRFLIYTAKWIQFTRT